MKSGTRDNAFPPKTAMLDKILFWVVLVWMVALLAMAVWAVREVWKEDSREEPDLDGAEPSQPSTPNASTPDTRNPNNPGPSQ